MEAQSARNQKCSTHHHVTYEHPANPAHPIPNLSPTTWRGEQSTYHHRATADLDRPTTNDDSDDNDNSSSAASTLARLPARLHARFSPPPPPAMSSAIVNFIRQRPALMRIAQPLSEWYISASGYRKLGLRYDDLLNEESVVGHRAIQRLSPAQTYERVFRLRRAVQCSLQQKLLPENEWTKPEEDVPYLRPIIEQIEAEIKEEKELDSLAVLKKH
jgi:ubiquinol-cytochrome c reductase subunit 7